MFFEDAGEEDEDVDSQLQSSTVESYLQILKEPKWPSIATVNASCEDIIEVDRSLPFLDNYVQFMVSMGMKLYILEMRDCKWVFQQLEVINTRNLLFPNIAYEKTQRPSLASAPIEIQVAISIECLKIQ
ncbi:hypothetical protein L7F22_056062, partial [Adiantum nelumboides]|nr:hypothetical protein [Adiantum nelumboides]